MSAFGSHPLTKSSSTKSELGSACGTLGGASVATSALPAALQLGCLSVLEHRRDGAVQRRLRDVARLDRDVLELADQPVERRCAVVRQVLGLLLALGRGELFL